MNTSVPFCTCPHTDCQFHPTNHDKGCTLCIQKNLPRGEIPACFFVKVEGPEHKTGDTFEDFARLVLNK